MKKTSLFQVISRTLLPAGLVLGLTACGDGAIEEYYKNDILKERYFLKENEKGGQVKDGLYLRWDNKGNLRDSIEYSMGKKNGIAVSWFASGEKLSECSFVENAPNGKCLEWDDTGTLRKKVMWKNGKQHGVEIEYNKKGKMLESISWKDGQKDGPYLALDDDGDTLHIANWAAGKKEGEEKIFCPEEDKKHVIREQRTWVAGKREGKETYYLCLDGKISSILNWKEDKMHGDFISWNETGKKVVEKFVDGVKK